MMLPLRIRKAEVAMADGRLDDAYQQAIREDVRDHRKGQRLIGRLTKAYERRAQVHLKAGNATAALSDAERAVRLGGNQPGIVALRDEARYEVDSHQLEKQARSQKIAAAKRCIASGDYTLGANICKDVEDSGHTVAGLMQDAELNRRIVESTLERGRKALKSAQWEQALDALDEAKRLQPTHADVIELASQVTQGVAKHARQTIARGRLDQADLLLRRVRRHAAESLEVEELSRVLGQCRKAAASSRDVEISDAVADLKALKQVIPEARWLDASIKDAETVARSIENLRTGPLGAILLSDHTPADETIVTHTRRKAQPMRVFEATPVVPTNFLVHLDGTGSFLVLRKPSVTIGTSGRSREVDVTVQGQVGLPTITIERLDDDYFLSSDEPVPVNGVATTNTLLASQDQIRIGRRGSMHFALPNSASTSAALDFVGVRLSAGNARKVILMDDALVIGPQPSAHIQSLSMERAMVIHWRNGELRIRPMSRSTEAGGAVLELDRPHDVDGLSLVVTKASGRV